MLIDTIDVFDREVLPRLRTARKVAFDTETTGLRPWAGDHIAGFSLAFDDGFACYVPIGHPTVIPDVVIEKVGRRKVRRVVGSVERHFLQLPGRVLNAVFVIIRERNIWVIGHNLKFDLQMVEAHGINTEGLRVADTMIMARLANNLEKRVGLKVLGDRYLAKGSSAEKHDLDDLMKERGWSYKDEYGDTVKEYSWFTPEEIADYATRDAVLTRDLFMFLWQEISRTHQEPVFHRECRLLPVLVQMEMTGFRVDLDYCREQLEIVETKLADVTESIYALAGERFDIGSPAQVGRVFGRLGIQSTVLTPKGKESWNKAALAEVDHPLKGLIEEWRSLDKIKSTYLLNFLRFADEDGLIHADFQQIEAKTGRFSCRHPNLQNVTAKEKAGFELRRCFRPRPGHVFVLIDWSQMEIRIAADLSGDEVLKDAIRRGADIHMETAVKMAKVMGVELCGDKECPNSARWRKWAKTIFFGLLFGMGAKKLAAQLDVDEETAKEQRDAFWATYPQLAAWARRTRTNTQASGTARNRYMRLYRYPLVEKMDGTKEYGLAYAAVDHVVQGEGADMAKHCMIRIHHGLRASGLEAHIVAMIHDELVFECPVEEVDTVVRGATKVMIEFPHFSIPIEVEATVAEENWAEKVLYAKWKERRLPVAA